MQGRLLIQNEWRQLVHNQTLVVATLVLVATSIVVLYTSSSFYTFLLTQHQQEQTWMRQEFEGQGAVNPHGAAHFGHYVFKPISFLQAVDPGLSSYTGTSLRLEAHTQNEVVFSASQADSSLIRFGELHVALLLQFIIPLLVLFATYDVVTKEKTTGMLQLTISQGVSLRQVLGYKIGFYTFLASLWVVLILIVLYGFLWIQHQQPPADSTFWARIGLLWLLYTLYYGVLCAGSVWLSAWFSSSRNVLAVVLSAWLLGTVIIPRITASVGTVAEVLPSRFVFEQQIREESKKGINGHDPSDKRARVLRDSLLKQYQVDSLSRLPINADGITMQADEEYRNHIYDHYFGQLAQQMHQQNQPTRYAAFLNPFLAIRTLSMSLAETDLHHHFQFTAQAENYRRYLIKKLNDEFAYGGSRTGDWDWKVPKDYMKKIQDFHYQPPSVGWSLGNCLPECLALGGWILGVSVLVWIGSKKITID